MAVNESIAPSTIRRWRHRYVHTAGRQTPSRLTDEPLSVDEVLNAISDLPGGAVTFVGTVRNNNNGHEAPLYYEAYPAMVHRTLMDIIEE